MLAVPGRPVPNDTKPAQHRPDRMGGDHRNTSNGDSARIHAILAEDRSLIPPSTRDAVAGEQRVKETVEGGCA